MAALDQQNQRSDSFRWISIISPSDVQKQQVHWGPCWNCQWSSWWLSHHNPYHFTCGGCSPGLRWCGSPLAPVCWWKMFPLSNCRLILFFLQVLGHHAMFRPSPSATPIMVLMNTSWMTVVSLLMSKHCRW